MERLVRRLLLAVVGLTAVVVLGGCGGSSSAAPTTSAGHYGGTMTLLVNGNPDSIDTAKAYTFPIQQLLIDTNDGLVGFRRTGGMAGEQIVPDLATALPHPTGGGRTYVFHLRHGIRFSTGAQVTPADFTYTFERLFKATSPTDATFYGNIVGAAACLAHASTCDLGRGVVANSRAWTVTFHLVHPDPEFLDKLSLTFAFVVPVGTPEHDIGTHPLPATGPYEIQSYTPNHDLVMVRNPRFHQWSAAAQPKGYPDRIILRFAETSEEEATSVQQGQADWMADQPPADRLGQLAAHYPSQVHIEPLEATWFFALNTRVAPFDNLDARRAVNYAIDRNAAVTLYGGPRVATPTCQILPPNFPGYQPYCPYTKNPSAGHWSAPDMARARALITASGTKGESVQIYTQSDTVDESMAQYMQTVLNSLGYHTTIKTLTLATFVGVVANSTFHAQVFGYAWYQDYPAASDFINNQFACSSYHPASSANIDFSEYCSPAIDAGIAHAFALEDAGQPAQANAVWASLDREITNQAPWVPLFTPHLVDFVSARVAHYQFNPLWYFLIDQAWLR